MGTQSALRSVLLSLSGSDGFRSNNFTKLNGELEYHDLVSTCTVCTCSSYVYILQCIIAERLSARHPNSAARSRLAMFVCMYVSHASGIQL